MNLISLTAEDKQHCLTLALRRNGCKEADWTRRKSSEWSDEILNLIGIKGEWAASRHLSSFGIVRIPFDEGTYVSGDEGYDMTLSNGWRCAVKFNHRSVSPFLLIERKHDFAEPVDVAMLVCGQCNPRDGVCFCNDLRRPDRLTLVGWITRERFWQSCQESDWGLGTRWWARPSQLLPIQKLIDEVRGAA